MEKKYEVKYIDVLYIDGKVIPVSLEYKKDKKYINFILNNVKCEVEKMYINQATYNKAANTIVTFKALDNSVRYAELGTLTSAICNYGQKVGYKYSKLSIAKDIVAVNEKLRSDLSSDKICKYFATELSVAEIKDVAKTLQQGYDKNTIIK